MIRAAYVYSGLCLILGATSLWSNQVRADNKPLAARVAVDERVGSAIPLSLQVTDQRGQIRTLAELLPGDKPSVLSLAYYHCPGLCDISLRELASSLRASGFRLGTDYHALTVSIDPHDTPPTAAAKRTNVLALLHQGVSDDWPFATATPDTLAQLTQALGYRYDYDSATRQYAHPAVSILLTPASTIARYVYGPGLDVSTLRLALREARAGRGGASALIDRTILACFKFDPSTHRYEWLILRVMRGGAALFALLLLGLVIVFIRIGQRRRSVPS
jgi:protein SCO1/2